MNTLQRLKERFEEINKTDEPLRTRRLANLMSDLEKMYGIPALRNPEFELQNPKLMAFYRKVSAARKF